MHNYMTNGREEIVIRTDGQPTIAYSKVDGLAHTREALQAALREIDRRDAMLKENGKTIKSLQAVNASLAAKYDEIHALWMASEAKLDKVAAAIADMSPGIDYDRPGMHER